MEYREIYSSDPKWDQVEPGQYAVVRTDSGGDVVVVYTIETTRQQAVAFARAMGMSSTKVLWRDGDKRVETIPWD
jgi:hypothetical protein